MPHHTDPPEPPSPSEGAASAKPQAVALPATRRHLAVVGTVVLSLAWLGLALAQFTRATPAADVAPGPTHYRVHINHDNATDLQLLSGIGPRLAERIVAHRDRHGPFTERSDLDQVRYIGPRLLDRIEPWLRYDNPPATPR